MTTNDKMNTILFTHVTINIQSEQKATDHTNDHFNAETTNNLTTINKISNNKIINNQTINDHNHKQTLTGEILDLLYKERTFQKRDVTHLTKTEFKQRVQYIKVSINGPTTALTTSKLTTTHT